MFSTIFSLIIGAVSIYYFYYSNFFLGVLFLFWAISIKFGNELQRLITGLNKLTKHSDLERNCNVFIELGINYDQVLKHPVMDDLFKKLKEDKIVTETDQGAWINTLIENYKSKYRTDGSHEKIKFNIKNNLVWKNEKIDFNDSVYHEIFIPYTNGDNEENLFLVPKIQKGLNIRIFIVNGIIKLQIGDFSKKYSPKMLREGPLAVYQTYETVTSFPLMYFSYQHKIPEKYLNLSAYATESWKDFWTDRKTNDKRNTMTSDWVELNKEIRDYNYVCDVADESIDDKGRWKKIIKSFDQKKNQWLEKEGFKDPFARDEESDSYDSWKNDNIYHTNKYFVIFVSNFNEFKSYREEHLYTDYHKEEPF